MKNNISIILRSLLAIFLMGAMGHTLFAQEEGKTTRVRPVKNTFDGQWLIDNQTVMVPIKGTFEFDIQHRFGTVKNGYDDFWGLYAPANMRLGFSYAPIDKLNVGFGFTKSNLMWDFNAKYALFKQARTGGFPLSVTYFANVAVDTRDNAIANFHNSTDRYSYFHQLMVARKVTSAFSVQVAGSVSHFNAVPAYINTIKEITGLMKNDHVAVSVSAKYKVGSFINIIANYDQPITEHIQGNPNPNISFGLEMTSSAHTFQIFAGNYNFLVPQRNNVFNSNDAGEGEFLIGFNITRAWNF